MVFSSSGEGKNECWAEFIMTKLSFFSFKNWGLGSQLFIVAAILKAAVGLQLGASCVNQPFFICFIQASIHFLLFHPSLKGVQRHICGRGISYTAANTQTRKSSAERVEEEGNTGRRGWCVEKRERGEGIQETTGM